MRLKIERLGSIQTMQNASEQCSNCGVNAKCRRRDFSEQAWTVLLLWNEVQTTAVDHPICDGCYNELRETLIDRAEEIELAVNESPTPANNPSQSPSIKPSARPKVRKAS